MFDMLYYLVLSNSYSANYNGLSLLGVLPEVVVRLRNQFTAQHI